MDTCFGNNRCHVRRPGMQFDYLINKVDVCRWEPAETRLLVGVISSADNFKQRQAIRATWGGTSRRMGFKVVFFLGTTADDEVRRQVSEEDDFHDDIVQGNFIDAYQNLTFKTVMLIRWARDNCAQASFVLKIDDDMLLSVWDLAATLNQLQAARRTMWGWLYHRRKPVRNKTNKCYVSEKLYAPNVYPDFLSGTSYLISGDSVAILAKGIEDEPFYPLEDVFLTGIVAEKVLVYRESMAGFFCQHKRYRGPCAVPKLVTSHSWSPVMLKKMWKKVTSRLDLKLCRGLKDVQMIA
ncbi:lactosylceramide 1,3-N-acetyl-beta-D-glucosaminyltransferase A-like [Haemaphysalis longicornis]